MVGCVSSNASGPAAVAFDPRFTSNHTVYAADNDIVSRIAGNTVSTTGGISTVGGEDSIDHTIDELDLAIVSDDGILAVCRT